MSGSRPRRPAGPRPPVNFYTEALASGVRSPELRALIETSDAVEALIVRVHRARAAGPEDEREFEEQRRWLETHYSRWAPQLEPHWRKAKEGGAACASDPFTRLFGAPAAREFVGNRAALKALPPAREALNRLVLERQADAP